MLCLFPFFSQIKFPFPFSNHKLCVVASHPPSGRLLPNWPVESPSPFPFPATIREFAFPHSLLILFDRARNLLSYIGVSFFFLRPRSSSFRVKGCSSPPPLFYTPPPSPSHIQLSFCRILSNKFAFSSLSSFFSPRGTPPSADDSVLVLAPPFPTPCLPVHSFSGPW